MTKVMIIDDDKEWAADTAEYLRKQGLEVVTQTDSSKGIKKVIHEFFDVLVIDYKLVNDKNKDDGVGVIDKIRQSNLLVPIIFCSGQLEKSENMGDILIDSIKLGISDYFSKSKSANELLKLIQKCIDLKTDSILSTYESWYRKIKNKKTPVIVNSNGDKYTPAKIIDEIKKGTPLGIKLRKDLAKFALKVLN
ncbi:MAG: response regulator [Candidatus Diapherotrites archaeon]